MCLQDRVRAMMEGALISGIFMVFMFMTIYTPLGLITALALPVPFTIYAARNGWRRSILVVAVSSILTILIGALPSVLSALFAGSLGTVMGSLYRSHKKASIAFIGGTLTNLVFFLLSLVASFYIFGINPITTLQEMMRQSFETSQSVIERFGQVDTKQVEMLMGMVDMIASLIPMLLIVGSAQFAFINHWISRKILQRLGTPAPGFPPFREWQWPKSVLFYYLAILVISMLVGVSRAEGWYVTALMNIKPIFDIMMMIQGLSFVFFFSHAKGWGRGLPIIAIILAFLFPPFPFILTLIGILDLGMNLRKRSIRKI
jgi:uncharacterized protein YybS (DUF2232 family)